MDSGVEPDFAVFLDKQVDREPAIGGVNNAHCTAEVVHTGLGKREARMRKAKDHPSFPHSCWSNGASLRVEALSGKRCLLS